MKRTLLMFVTAGLLIAGVAKHASAEKPAVLVTGKMGIGIRFLIDPELEKRLTQDGYPVGSLVLEDLTAERLKQFNTVVLVQEAIGSAMTKVSVEQRAASLDQAKKPLLEYVRNGGGLLLFFDEINYSEATSCMLNRLLADLDAEVVREEIVEKDASRVHLFGVLVPRGHHRAHRTECIEPHAVTEGVKRLWWPMYTGTIKRMGKPWKVIITASETTETAQTYRTKPPLLAVRAYGKGRVALFMGHSSWYVNNGYHLAYEKGWCLEQDDRAGYRLFTNIFDWLGEPSQKSGLYGDYKPGTLPPLLKAGGTELKPYHDLDDAPAFAGVFGVYSNHSGGPYTVAEWAEKARSLGLKFLAFTDRIESRHVWEQLKADCLAASDEDFVAIPGVEFVAGEKAWFQDRKEFLRGKTSVGFAVNIDRWPPRWGLHSGNHLFVDTRLNTSEEHFGIYVLAQPKLNGMQPENLGGFIAFEPISYRGMHAFTSAMDWFRQIQANAGFSAAPIISHRLWMLDELEQVAAKGFKLYLFSKDAADARSLRNRTAKDTVPCFVSNGPVIERFWAEDMFCDPWERYFLWNVGDLVRIHLKVRSDVDLQEVRLYSGLRVIRRFFPAGGQLDKTIECPVTQEGPFYVEVKDRSGRIALSYAIPTRNLNYWNHVGGDRMNDYHNPILPDPAGEILYKGQRFSSGGLVTFGYGWGDYCRVNHPTTGYRLLPQGYETGHILAGLHNIRTYPILNTAKRTREQAAPMLKRSMPFSTRDVSIVHQKADQIRRNLETIPARFLYSETTSTLFRYDFRPFGNIILLCDLEARVLNRIPLGSSRGLELETFELQYVSRNKINKVSYIDPAGKLQTLDYDPSGMKLRLGKGGFVTLWPDPFGLAAIYSLDQDVDVYISGVTRKGEKEVPLVKLGFDLDGQALMKDREFQCRVLVCQEAGGVDVEYWQKLRRLWGLAGPEAATRPKVTHGKYLKTEYITAFAAEAGAVVTEIPTPEILPNNIFPLTVDAMNADWSAGAYSSGRYYPGAVYKGKLYLGLEGDWLDKQIFLGHPLIADDKELVIEIRELSDKKVTCYAYNPTSKAIEATIQTSPAIGVRGFKRKIRLAPGEGKLITD